MNKNKLNVIIKIAWRNIFRNKRRSLITCGAIVFGLTMLIYLNGLYNGFYEQMINNVVELQTGHIKISQKDFYNKISIENYISDPQKTVEKINKMSNANKIAGISERVKFPALISSSENSFDLMVVGISPQKEKLVSILEKTIIKGKYLQDDDMKSILIGEDLSDNLSVKIGEEIVVLTQGLYGSIATKALKVKGIFKTGIPNIDKTTVYIPLVTAKNIIGYNNETSEVVVLLKNSKYLDEIYSSINVNLNDENLKTRTWKDLAPDMVEIIRINVVNMNIIMGIVFALVALGILNTTNMSIFERFKELGIITAIGMKSKEILLMIISEAFFLSIIGGIIGAFLGLGSVLYSNIYGFDMSQFAKGVQKYIGLNTMIYSVFTWEGVLVPLLFVFAISIFASIYPAIKATQLEITDIIRHI